MTVATADPDLVGRAGGGDRAAFDALVTEHVGFVRAAVRRIVGHPDDTEDIVQDALMQAWLSIGSFRGEAKFSTWLMSIAARKAVDFLRKTRRWRKEAQIAYANHCADTPDAAGEVFAVIDQPDFTFEVREHIAYCFSCVGRSLPPDEQATLVLRDVMGLSAREAADVLGTSDAVLRHRLSAARTSMREKYDDLCALVNKRGMCHQCKGLRELRPDKARDEPMPDLAAFSDRVAMARGADPETSPMRAFHDLFWRRTDELEEAGGGSTDPRDDACGAG